VTAKPYRLVLCLGVLAAVAACDKQEALFVVLPNPDGSSGAVTVEDGKSSLLLDKPYAAGEVRSGRAVAATAMPDQVQKLFGEALAAQPILPGHFRLYFVSDSNVLTRDSDREYRAVFDDIKRRPVYEVEVIGHTDTLGDRTYNQRLSLSRARAIGDRLVRDGLSRDSIKVSGRGELDLAVPSSDEVSEPRNRRVEIDVR
jgi:outer membrane protein OmpA-like peptidoglycan-associated protein